MGGLFEVKRLSGTVHEELLSSIVENGATTETGAASLHHRHQDPTRPNCVQTRHHQVEQADWVEPFQVRDWVGFLSEHVRVHPMFNRSRRHTSKHVHVAKMHADGSYTAWRVSARRPPRVPSVLNVRICMTCLILFFAVTLDSR